MLLFQQIQSRTGTWSIHQVTPFPDLAEADDGRLAVRRFFLAAGMTITFLARIDENQRKEYASNHQGGLKTCGFC